MSPCTPFDFGRGGSGFICTSGRRKRCAYCHEPGTQLCDHRITAPEFGKPAPVTCDRPMCPAHAHHVDPDHDYCRSHLPGAATMTATLFDDDDAPATPTTEPADAGSAPRRPQVVRVWANTRGLGKCRDCGAPMTWFQVVESGKKMPFEADPTPVAILQADNGRAILELRAEDTHFRTCPQAMSFRRPR